MRGREERILNKQDHKNFFTTPTMAKSYGRATLPLRAAIP